MSDLPIFDPRPLQDLLGLGGPAELVHELIALFEQDVPARLRALKAALDASDVAPVLMEAHQLKGSLSCLGLVRFTELAARIESQARQDLKQVPLLIESLPAAYEEALCALNAAFPKD